MSRKRFIIPDISKDAVIKKQKCIMDVEEEDDLVDNEMIKRIQIKSSITKPIEVKTIFYTSLN